MSYESFNTNYKQNALCVTMVMTCTRIWIECVIDIVDILRQCVHNESFFIFIYFHRQHFITDLENFSRFLSSYLSSHRLASSLCTHLSNLFHAFAFSGCALKSMGILL